MGQVSTEMAVLKTNRDWDHLIADWHLERPDHSLAGNLGENFFGFILGQGEGETKRLF